MKYLAKQADTGTYYIYKVPTVFSLRWFTRHYIYIGSVTQSYKIKEHISIYESSVVKVKTVYNYTIRNNR